MIAARRLFWAVAALVSLQYLAGAVVFLAYPDTRLGPGVDAVVVLAGSDTRLPVARRLMERGVAPVLLVSHATPSDDEARERFCAAAGAQPYRVICRKPEPFSTRGEARLAAGFAQREGWKAMAVVTSRFHLFRTRLLFARCTDATLVLRGSPEPWYRHLSAIPSEWLKLAIAATVRQGC